MERKSFTTIPLAEIYEKLTAELKKFIKLDLADIVLYSYDYDTKKIRIFLIMHGHDLRNERNPVKLNMPLYLQSALKNIFEANYDVKVVRYTSEGCHHYATLAAELTRLEQ